MPPFSPCLPSGPAGPGGPYLKKDIKLIKQLFNIFTRIGVRQYRAALTLFPGGPAGPDSPVGPGEPWFKRKRK